MWTAGKQNVGFSKKLNGAIIFSNSFSEYIFKYNEISVKEVSAL